MGTAGIRRASGRSRGTPLIVTEDPDIIEGETVHPDHRYSNLWVLRLDTLGRAHRFAKR